MIDPLDIRVGTATNTTNATNVSFINVGAISSSINYLLYTTSTGTGNRKVNSASNTYYDDSSKLFNVEEILMFLTQIMVEKLVYLVQI